MTKRLARGLHFAGRPAPLRAGTEMADTKWSALGSKLSAQAFLGWALASGVIDKTEG